MQTIRGHIGVVGEELRLPRGAIARQDIVAGAESVADAGGNADAQSGPAVRGILEGFPEHAAGIFEFVVRVGGDRIAAVRCAVVDADNVVQATAEDFALQLNAEIAIRRQLGGKPAFDQRDRAAGLQSLQTHRALDLADAHGGARIEFQIDVGIDDGGAVAGEFRREAEADQRPPGAFQRRPDAPEQEGIVLRRSVVADEEARVRLHQAAHLQLQTIGRFHRQAPGGRQRYHRILRCFCSGLFGLQFEFAFDHAQALVEIGGAADSGIIGVHAETAFERLQA